jgi:hypothetical protein
MRAKPRLTKDDLKKLRPKRLGGGQKPTPDSGHPDFDHHESPPKLDSDPLARDGADEENRELAKAIRDALRTTKRNPERFVLTWRMYPNKNRLPPEGRCGCGCSCS